MARSIVEIAVNVPLLHSFHYLIPPRLAERLELGHRVLVPFGGRLATGVCVGFQDSSPVPATKLKPVRQVLHPDSRFDAHLLALTRWTAEYYHCGWGEVLEAALPPAIRSGRSEPLRREVVAARPPAELEAEAARLERRARAQSRVLRHLGERWGVPASEAQAQRPARVDRRNLLAACRADAATIERLEKAGWLRQETIVDRRDPYADEGHAAAPRVLPELNPDQVAAVEAIVRGIDAGGFRAFLLHGVTGSGKTEVYLGALRHTLESGRRGLVLLPEIALTPQTVRRFREALPRVGTAVLHSMLSPAERTGQWKEIQEGKARLVIGARSAVFAPVPDLGLIVVDEEHEPSYKQESSPRYHGRDVAVMRASLLGIPVVLGSATPSLESIHNVRCGKYALLRLPRRATQHDLPRIQVVPLDARFYQPDGRGLLSEPLHVLIRRQLRAGEQTLLYLNRRGFSTHVHCLRCGLVLRCEHCDVTLTFHRGARLLRCHYCGHARRVPELCPDCSSPRLRKSGVGTEKVVYELARRYPEARIARLDRDSVTSHRVLRETLGAFARGEFDLLVGTQMVAKGHDFPRVSLVGIVLADTGLHFPDFRAAERTFQLITQVAGRAGRGKRSGRVIVQTFSPEHYAVQRAAIGDLEGFCDTELEYRRALGYPPFGRLVKLVLSGRGEAKVSAEAARVAKALRAAAAAGVGDGGASGSDAGDMAPPLPALLARGGGPRVLGPAPAPIARLQDRYRAQILVKARTSREVREILERSDSALRARKGVELSIDVDPQSML